MNSSISLAIVLLVALCGLLSAFQLEGQQAAAGEVGSPFKNGARPSFRQYSTYGNDQYSNQYGNNGYPSGGGQYDTQYNSNSQYGQRYPQQYGDSSNGFQRDPRFNSATTIGGSKAAAALCAAVSIAFVRTVLNF
ncbi:hypothetical protein M3Y99_00894300 [Aphelenchoides fujianensis]|nr:hypothetical protein M3Y99_00894300 [Aphelenchoides fujianensis]